MYRGVEKPESIADHMYRMAILAMTVAGTEYDQNKLVKMAIVHDLAEAIVGDITPVDGVSEEAKYSRELAALKEIQTMIGIETAVAQEVGQLWCVSDIFHVRSVLYFLQDAVCGLSDIFLWLCKPGNKLSFTLAGQSTRQQ